MPNIREYRSPIDKLTPTDAGYSAWETAGRRIGPLYNQQASDIKEAGKLDAQKLAEAGKLNTDALDYLGELNRARASRSSGSVASSGGTPRTYSPPGSINDTVAPSPHDFANSAARVTKAAKTATDDTAARIAEIYGFPASLKDARGNTVYPGDPVYEAARKQGLLDQDAVDKENARLVAKNYEGQEDTKAEIAPGSEGSQWQKPMGPGEWSSNDPDTTNASYVKEAPPSDFLGTVGNIVSTALRGIAYDGTGAISAPGSF